MPTLIERIRNLTDQIKSQADSKVNEDEAKGFRTRSKELSDPSDEISVATRRLELFQAHGIPVKLPLPNASELKKSIDEISDKYASDPLSIISANTGWRFGTKNQLSSLSRIASEEATSAWNKYLSDLKPPIDQGIIFVLRSSPAYAEQLKGLQTLSAEFSTLEGRLPTSEEEISRPKELAEEMLQASENLPEEIPEPVQDLFRAINSGNATAVNLTDEASAWLRENELLPSLKISWGEV